MRGDFFMRFDFLMLRTQVYTMLRQWKDQGKEVPYQYGEGLKFLTKLLGYKNTTDFIAQVTEEDMQILKALIGPHGWAIYKMLEARKSK